MRASIADVSGCGPYECSVSPDSLGAQWIDMPVLTDVPSAQAGCGSRDGPTDYSLVAQVPQGIVCTGDSGACLVMCKSTVSTALIRKCSSPDSSLAEKHAWKLCRCWPPGSRDRWAYFVCFRSWDEFPCICSARISRCSSDRAELLFDRRVNLLGCTADKRRASAYHQARDPFGGFRNSIFNNLISSPCVSQRFLPTNRHDCRILRRQRTRRLG